MGVFRRGDIWWIRYSKTGRQYRESAESTKKIVATRLLQRRKEEISSGKRPGIMFERVTFEQLAAELIRDYKIHGRKSLDRAKRSVKRLSEFFSGWKVPQITSPAINRYVEHRMDRGIAPATINRELAALKRMFNLGLQQTPPFVRGVPKITMLREDNVRKGFFEHAEFEALLSELPGFLHPFASFAYKTGWRFQEVSSLTWVDVNRQDWSVSISGDRTKNRDSRIVFLDDDLKAMFQNLWAERKQSQKLLPWVFPNSNRTGRIKDIRWQWFGALKRAGLPRRLFHDLRRTAVRNMVRAGVPEIVAMKISGHKTRAIFDRYNIASDRDLKEAAEKQKAYLDGQKKHNFSTIVNFRGHEKKSKSL